MKKTRHEGNLNTWRPPSKLASHCNTMASILLLCMYYYILFIVWLTGFCQGWLHSITCLFLHHVFHRKLDGSALCVHTSICQSGPGVRCARGQDHLVTKFRPTMTWPLKKFCCWRMSSGWRRWPERSVYVFYIQAFNMFLLLSFCLFCVLSLFWVIVIAYLLYLPDGYAVLLWWILVSLLYAPWWQVETVIKMNSCILWMSLV